MRFIPAALIFSIIIVAGCTVSSRCGIEECHGLDITCGPNVPEVCTMEYRLGDFCRAYAKCTAINGACTLEPSSQFTACKECVLACTGEPVSAFDCEAVCREEMDKYCESDGDCSCGRRIDTDECFYGSSELVNTSKQCPDYCTGIAANLEIRCIDNLCTQVQR